VLGEGRRRLDLMRECQQDVARGAKVSRQEGQGNRVQAPVRSVRLHRPWPPEVRSGRAVITAGFNDHLPGHVAQTAATRAFNAVLQYALGKRGRPRFKRRDMYDSIEGKEVKSTIIWQDGCVRFAGMMIPAILDPADAWQSETLKIAH
jgi:putative transposase